MHDRDDRRTLFLLRRDQINNDCAIFRVKRSCRLVEPTSTIAIAVSAARSCISTREPTSTEPASCLQPCQESRRSTILWALRCLETGAPFIELDRSWRLCSAVAQVRVTG